MEIIGSYKQKEEEEESVNELSKDTEGEVAVKVFSEKNRPNYFLCVRVTNDHVKDAVRKV